MIDRIRKNHALEHATLHLVARSYPQAWAAGFSYGSGFTLATDLAPEAVYPLVEEALERLKAGESALRIHPNCGTNLAVTATFVTAVALAALRGWDRQRSTQQRIDLIARAILAEMVALIIAAPLALFIQAKVTTDADLDNLAVREMVSGSYGKLNLIHVRTEHP